MPVINPIILDPDQIGPEGPCNWGIDTTCVPEWGTYTPNVQNAAVSWATYILWALTGRRFGGCAVTVRPCGPKCGVWSGYLTFPVNAGSVTGGNMPWMIPWIDNGVWRNCGCAGSCSCRATCEVVLPGPVQNVLEVTVDGVTLPSTAYRLDYVGGLPTLVRVDGECWPECQNMDLATDQPDTFSVTYVKGEDVPIAGKLAAGKLASEFAKACSGQECVLPQQLASLSRNGVEVQVMDPTTLLDQGLTGVSDVDLWIRAVNPHARAQRSRVYSPDLRAARYTL